MDDSADLEKKLPPEQVSGGVVHYDQAQLHKVALAEEKEKEKRVRRKIDMVVLPMASAVYPSHTIPVAGLLTTVDVPRFLHPISRQTITLLRQCLWPSHRSRS